MHLNWMVNKHTTHSHTQRERSCCCFCVTNLPVAILCAHTKCQARPLMFDSGVQLRMDRPTKWKKNRTVENGSSNDKIKIRPAHNIYEKWTGNATQLESTAQQKKKTSATPRCQMTNKNYKSYWAAITPPTETPSPHTSDAQKIQKRNKQVPAIRIH